MQLARRLGRNAYTRWCESRSEGVREQTDVEDVDLDGRLLRGLRSEWTPEVALRDGRRRVERVGTLVPQKRRVPCDGPQYVPGHGRILAGLAGNLLRSDELD